MNVRQGVLWDSSAILALLDADDFDHERAVAIAGQIAAEKRPGFITNYIEVEAHALLLRKLGRTLAREWLLTGGMPVVRALPEEEDRAREIVARHSDKNWKSSVTRFPLQFSICGKSAALSRSIAISFSTEGSRSSAYRADSGRRALPKLAAVIELCPMLPAPSRKKVASR